MKRECNMRGRIAQLIITIFAGILLLLIVEGLLIIHNTPFSSAEVLASTNPDIITILHEPLRMGQTYTKTKLCGAEAFSEESEDYSADKAIDGLMDTRWSSKFYDPQWISITLCEERTINRVVLHWETAYGKYYQIHVSQDGETWYKVFSTQSGDGGEDVITFDAISARYVRMCGILRGTRWGYSLWEFEVFETGDPPVVPIPFPPVLKGSYPRWFYKELGYWTVAGSPGSERETLFSDDGMVGNPTASAFWGIWGTSPSNVFAVGSGGTILRYTGTAWSAMHSITTSHLYGVWGSSDSNVFAVGDNGTILRYNGRTWSTMNSTTTSHLYGVWGSSDSNVFAVGSGGTILHHNGNTWSTMDSMTMSHLYGVWGNSDSSVFAVGENGTILHYTGTVWSAMDSTTMSHLYGVWGDSDSSVFAVGENGTILHYIGTVWSAMDSMVIGHLYGVWGSSSADVFAVGGDGVILHYTGTWSATVSGTTSYLRGVWGSSPDIFAVGESGTLLHSDGGAWERASFGNGFSLMPYLTVAGKFITWADVATITHSLKDGYLPFPEVEWHYQGLCFSQRVFPYAADVGDSYNYISYTLKNTGTTTISDRLYLTIRPFQVRPPWMYGGLQEITSIEREGDNRFRINGNRWTLDK